MVKYSGILHISIWIISFLLPPLLFPRFFGVLLRVSLGKKDLYFVDSLFPVNFISSFLQLGVVIPTSLDYTLPSSTRARM